MSPQTPPRRRGAATPATPPSRRPRVAGLRKPAGSPVEEAHDTEVIPAVRDDAPAVEEAPAAKPTPRPRKRAATENRPAWEAAPRVRRAGTLLDEQPEDDKAEAAEDGQTGEPGADGRRVSRWPSLVTAATGGSRSGLLVPIVLAVVTVILGGFAVFAGIQAASLNSGVSAENTAITDNAGTSEVIGEVTSAVNTLFSYNYTDLAKTQNAVKTLLTGNAVCQYNTIFKTVQDQAPSQKLVLTTTVVDSAVQMLQGDTARVLLVVDQHDTRATTNQSSDSTAAFAVNAIQSGGKWKISEIDTFNGANPTCSSK